MDFMKLLLHTYDVVVATVRYVFDRELGLLACLLMHMLIFQFWVVGYHHCC